MIKSVTPSYVSSSSNPANFILGCTLIILILFTSQVFFSQGTFILSGKVFNKETKEVLPFATIHHQGNYAIANEEGAFELKLKNSTKWVKVNYTGFKADSIPLHENTKHLDIYLVAQPNVLSDVVVSAKSGNYRYKLFYKAVESYFKNGLKEINCKSYYRTYTLLNSSQPAELFESYYNLNCNAQEIKNLKLKGGKFLLPRKKTFINMASTVLLEMFKPCIEGQEVFPYSPLQCVSVTHLKNKFNITIKNIIQTDNDSLYHFSFSPTDTVNSFSGELYYYKKQNRVEKLKLYATNVTQHPLYSMRDPDKDKITKLNYAVEIGYKDVEGRNFINYINFDMLFNLNTGNKQDFVKTNMKLLNFDYGKNFSLPLLPDIDFKHDYERVAVYPYNTALFENNHFMKEAADEKKVRELFTTIRCYDSESLDESILFLQKRFQRWSPEWQLDKDLIDTVYIPEAHVRYGNNYSKSKKALWDSVFAYTCIFLDYDCYGDSTTFLTNALLDYKFSFARNKRNPVHLKYFQLYLNSCKNKTNELSRYLAQKYKDTCPGEEEIKQDYKKFSDANVTDAYFIHAAGNSLHKTEEYEKLKSYLFKNSPEK